MGKIEPPQNIFRSKQTLAESIIMMIIGFVGIIFNTTVIYFLMRKKRRLRSFEILLLNLACADTLVGTFSITSEIIRLTYGTNGEVRGEIISLTFNAFTFFSVMSSALNIICITADRFIAVRFPFQHRVWVTRSRAIIAEVAVWFLSFSNCLLIIVMEKPWKTIAVVDDYRTAVSGVILASGITVAAIYTYIIYTVNQSKKAIGSHRKDHLVMITCALVVMAYLVCMFPFALEAIIKVIKLGETKWDVTFPVLALVYLNSAVNPLMYFYKKIAGKRKKKKSRLTPQKIVENDNCFDSTPKLSRADQLLTLKGQYGAFDNKGQDIDKDVEGNGTL